MHVVQSLITRKMGRNQLTLSTDGTAAKLKGVTNKTCKSSRVKKTTKTTNKKKVSTQKNSSSTWKVGDSITKTTKSGKKPSWSTTRARYWKNEAARNPSKYSYENRVRMRKGKAPQRYNAQKGKMESMELHHKIPRRKYRGVISLTLVLATIFTF